VGFIRCVDADVAGQEFGGVLKRRQGQGGRVHGAGRGERVKEKLPRCVLPVSEVFGSEGLRNKRWQLWFL
jgi:hypothetical protein